MLRSDRFPVVALLVVLSPIRPGLAAQKPDVEELISWLGSTDTVRSSYATRELMRVADRVAARLISRLQPSNPTFERAVQILGCASDSRAWQALRRTYDEIPDRTALSTFLRGLSHATHPHAIALHVRVLAEPDRPMHRYAWAGLSRFPREKLGPHRRALLGHVDQGLSDVECAPYVLRVLGKIGPERGAAFFLPFLAAEDKEVRSAASEALASLGGEGSATALRALVADAARAPESRLAAFGALARLPEGLPDKLLLSALRTDALQVAAAEVVEKKSLAGLKAIQPEVEGALVAIVRSGKDDSHVLRALAKFRSPTAEELWRKLVADRQRPAHVRTFALGHLTASVARDPELSDIVRSLVTDPKENLRVRTDALGVLARYPDEQTAKLLLEGSQSEEPLLQGVAAQNLHRLPPSRGRTQAYVHVLKTAKDRYARRSALWGLASSRDEAAHRLVLEWLESDERYNDRQFANQIQQELGRQRKAMAEAAGPGAKDRGP